MSIDLLRRNRYVWQYNGNPEGPHAILHKGGHSGYFVNASGACCDPSLLHKLVTWSTIKSMLGITLDNIKTYVREVDRVMCPGYGAMGLAAHIARFLDVPWGFTDKIDDKTHILKRFDVKDQRILLVEDVVTTGDSLIQVFNLIENAGGRVMPTAITLVNRSGKACVYLDPENYYAVVGIYDIPDEKYSQDECPYCAAGSPALASPKSHWDLFMKYNKIGD